MREKLEQQEQSDRDYRRPLIRVPLPWGNTPLEIRGHDIVSIALCFYVGATLYLFHEADAERAVEHKMLIQAQNENTFIIHLSPEERAALKLPIPDSLRKRVGQEEYYNFLQERYKKELERDILSGKFPQQKQFTPAEMKAAEKGNP